MFLLVALLWHFGKLCYKPYAELSNLACRLLAIPATSASIERSFSKQLRIHSKDHNKLLNTRVAKLLTAQS